MLVVATTVHATLCLLVGHVVRVNISALEGDLKVTFQGVVLHRGSPHPRFGVSGESNVIWFLENQVDAVYEVSGFWYLDITL